MAAELVLWSSREFDLVRLSEDYATGSSIMPQKRNPDAAELVRGKAGRVQGDLQALLTLSKGLPLAYNRDLQEDREVLFDAVDTTVSCLAVTAGMWRSLEVNADRYKEELKGDFLLATEIADFLVDKGLPFREAHHVVGELVSWCEAQGGNFSLLDARVLASHHPLLEAGVLDLLEPEAAVERRSSTGGTAWSEVLRQTGLLRATLRH